jgi:M6 family metalloprotease-like protein
MQRGNSSEIPAIAVRAFLLPVIILCSLLADVTRAVPANPAPSQVTQPDGTGIVILLKGDENAHWNETEDGYLIKRDEPTGVWHYVTESGLPVAATAVGAIEPQSIGAVTAAQAGVVARATQQRNAMLLTQGEPAHAPLTGTMRNLVVLVNFSDSTITLPNQSYDDLFNQVGYTADGAVGSVKDYYLQVSFNALTVQSTIAGPVTLDHGFAYYGADSGGAGSDVRPREMVSEALAKLEAQGFDFSALDGDADGWVDGLTIIHAGGGQEYGGNNANYIWSHKWQLTNSVTYDGVKMQTYHTEPARRGWDNNSSSQGITRIGVICHENGHFLGLPDLYDYGYDSKGVGTFCLMSGGSWNGDDGTSPAHMSAWCRSELNWATPTVISGVGNYTLAQVETSGQIYKLRGPFPSTQYFLVENRQGTGFDSGLPGSQRGILIWHVDETVADNDNQAHYMVDLEEASGTQHLELNQNSGNDADYFRTGTMTAFNATSTPNNKSYAGVSVGMNIANISATGASMTFKVVIPPTITGITPNSGTAGTTVSVTNLAGTGFVAGADVKLSQSGQSDIVATDVVVQSGTQITCTLVVPSDASGQWDVVVTNPDGQSATLTNGFTVHILPPSALSITPDIGMAGTRVAVTDLAGTAFLSGATVKLTQSGQSNITATSVVVTWTRITCTFNLPVAAVGLWNVVVTNPDGQSDTLVEGFTIIPPNAPAQLTDITITPLNGSSCDVYRFSVRYHDVEGDTPVGGDGTVSIRGAASMTFPMTLESGTAEDGVYSGQVQFTTGSYGFRFSFYDTADMTAGTVWQSGPFVKLCSETTNDELVNFAELANIAAHWRQSACSAGNQWCSLSDTDHSGAVDTGDMLVVSNDWMHRGGERLSLIPAGQFQMGDSADGTNSAELPVHLVSLDSYYVGRFEVTNAEYCEALNWALAHGYITVSGGLVSGVGNGQPYCDTTTSSAYSRIVWNGSTFSVVAGKEDHPMAMVSWMGAAACCNWLSMMDMRQPCYDLSTWACDSSKDGFRLPTEAEWEYAARGRLAGARYPWGSTISGLLANYYNSGDPYQAGSQPYTTPVGFYDGGLHSQTEFGWPGTATTWQTGNGINGYLLFDMAGNVHEMCNDWYDDDYYSTRPSPDVSPTGPASGATRVTRGGSWKDTSTSYCRASWRSGTPANMRVNTIGFRVAASGD